MNFILPRKQPPLRSQQKKNLYKLLIARSDVGASLTACKLMRETVSGFESELYYPLFAAVVVCYARPFTNNEPYGALPSKWAQFSDTSRQETHDKIIKARHELIAHSDMIVRKASIIPPGVASGKLGERELTSTKIGTQTSLYLYPMPFFNKVWETALDLYSRLNAEIDRLVDTLYDGMDLPSHSFDLKMDEGL